MEHRCLRAADADGDRGAHRAGGRTKIPRRGESGQLVIRSWTERTLPVQLNSDLEG